MPKKKAATDCLQSCLQVHNNNDNPKSYSASRIFMTKKYNIKNSEV